MTQSKGTNHWMKLDHLQNVDGSFALWFRIGRRSDEHKEVWTSRTNDFKDGQPAAIAAALAVIQEASRHLRPLLRRCLLPTSKEDVSPEETLFIPALSSWQTISHSESQLARLAASAAAGYGARTSYEILRKTPHASLSRTGANAVQREEIVTNANYRSAKVNARNVVIVDDVSTSGSTLSAIATAVKASNHDVRVFCIVLAKQESLDFLPFETAEEANARVSHKLDQIWREYA